jgi:serine/threonine protein kinase
MDLDRVKIGDILPNISLIDSTFSGNGMGGAPYYKSPESIKGEPFTVQSDIWLVSLEILK